MRSWLLLVAISLAAARPQGPDRILSNVVSADDLDSDVKLKDLRGNYKIVGYKKNSDMSTEDLSKNIASLTPADIPENVIVEVNESDSPKGTNGQGAAHLGEDEPPEPLQHLTAGDDQSKQVTERVEVPPAMPKEVPAPVPAAVHKAPEKAPEKAPTKIPAKMAATSAAPEQLSTPTPVTSKKTTRPTPAESAKASTTPRTGGGGGGDSAISPDNEAVRREILRLHDGARNLTGGFNWSQGLEKQTIMWSQDCRDEHDQKPINDPAATKWAENITPVNGKAQMDPMEVVRVSWKMWFRDERYWYNSSQPGVILKEPLYFEDDDEFMLRPITPWPSEKEKPAEVKTIAHVENILDPEYNFIAYSASFCAGVPAPGEYTGMPRPIGYHGAVTRFEKRPKVSDNARPVPAAAG